MCIRDSNNNNNNPICKAPECQKTSVALADRNMYVVKIFHLALSVSLHCLVKLENYNCCWSQWRIACGTSEFSLQDMWRPNSADMNPITRTSGKLSKGNPWCQWTEAVVDWGAAVNSANVCKLVFIPAVVVSSTCFNFQSVCQIDWPHYVLVMVVLCNRADHYIFALWFVYSSFFPHLISAAAEWMFTILPHMVWP